jgi:ATP-binding cassette, subfamily F, member 3
LLDEPTNHLDFISENILIQALQQYQGSFVVVSHNRHFISQVANKIWYIENHQIKEYPGTYEEYEYWRKNNPVSAEPPPVKKPDPPKQEKKTPSQESENRVKSLQQQLKKIEVRIGALEAEKKILEEEMALPANGSDFEKLKVLQEKFESISSHLHEENKKWEAVIVEMDKLEETG